MRIFADTRYLPEGLPHGPLLRPFWGPVGSFTKHTLGSRRFDSYVANASAIFELTSLAQSDAAVVPFDWEQIAPEAISSRRDLALFGQDARTVARTIEQGLQAARDLTAAAEAHGKPVIIFIGHYGGTPALALEGSWTFRSSLSASRRWPHQFAQPFWIEDEVETRFGGRLPLRAKPPVATVAFCGFVAMRPAKRWMATLARRSRAPLHGWAEWFVEPNFRPRARAMRHLARSRALRTHFTFRDRWFDNLFDGDASAARIELSRREYFDSLIASDYVLCTRGYQNCSIRLYETLCCGRIPVFVNTDCVLPYDRWIDWKRYCVWVEEEDVAHIGPMVAEFHDRLSPEAFLERQQACRQLWLDWLSPEGFFRNLHRHLQ
jgi:hypothetical protein